MFSNGISKSARKRVELAVAVAQDRLLSEHVVHALDLIAAVEDDMSFTDAISVYIRLMRLHEDDAQNVRTRALATLGTKVENGDPLVAGTDDDQQDEPQGLSWLRRITEQITDRVRGREDPELRRRIELIAARAEVALIETHVDNALHFVEFLEQEDEIGEQKAVEIYLDALEVRDSVAEVTYYHALNRISDDVLPPRGFGAPTAPDEADSGPADGSRDGDDAEAGESGAEILKGRS